MRRILAHLLIGVAIVGCGASTIELTPPTIEPIAAANSVSDVRIEAAPELRESPAKMERLAEYQVFTLMRDALLSSLGSAGLRRPHGASLRVIVDGFRNRGYGPHFIRGQCVMYDAATGEVVHEFDFSGTFRGRFMTSPRGRLESLTQHAVEAIALELSGRPTPSN